MNSALGHTSFFLPMKHDVVHFTLCFLLRDTVSGPSVDCIGGAQGICQGSGRIPYDRGNGECTCASFKKPFGRRLEEDGSQGERQNATEESKCITNV